MYGYIYKTTNVITGKIYIGKHNLKHIESIVIHNSVSHFNKTNKKDFESIEIFEV